MRLSFHHGALALGLVLTTPALAEEPRPTATAVDARLLSEKELVTDDDEAVRLSLPTEADWAAWQLHGLRITLGYGYGRFAGNLTGIDTTTHHIILRPSVRLDEHWSLAATCTYSIALNELSGLRWSVSLNPTWHPWSGLGLTLGAGYAGFIASRNLDEEYAYYGEATGQPIPQQDVPVETWDKPTRTRSVLGDEHLTNCVGAGWNLLARAEYLFVVGPRFASGPFVQADHQWVRCQDDTGNSNPETGRPVRLQEWWRHQGLSLGWWFSWR